MKKIACLSLALVLCTTLFTGCKVVGGGGEKLKVTSDELQFLQPATGDIIATINTSEGVVKILLFPQIAPKAVENFVTHATNGYYNGLTFHRTVEDFVVQGGDPKGDGTGGESIWGLPFEDEFSDLLHHYTGAVSMANSGVSTNGSQFFFVVTPIGKLDSSWPKSMEEAGWRKEVIEAYNQAGGTPYLDYKHTVFGQIYDGLDVAFKISRVDTSGQDKPKKDVVINSIEITTVE